MKKRDRTAAISREYHNFLADMESLLQETANLTGDELHGAKEKIQQRVAEAKVSMTDLSDDLARRARKSARTVNNEVHDEPWKAIGAGAAAGLLLGILFARR
jgi:ElaB/YqjD/DUF883 family membrane-anchored ribosome-binding protein